MGLVRGRATQTNHAHIKARRKIKVAARAHPAQQPKRKLSGVSCTCRCSFGPDQQPCECDKKKPLTSYSVFYSVYFLFLSRLFQIRNESELNLGSDTALPTGSELPSCGMMSG
jgi:hypothetical protein